MLPNALISRHQFVELCSALRYSSHLKDLSIKSLLNRLESPKGDCDWQVGWAWLAFAVLHPDSDIRLDHLDISHFAIEGKNMELVAEIITSVRPGRRLWELQHGLLPPGISDYEEIDLPADQRFFVTLAPGDVKILSRPEIEASVLFTVTDATERFEVLLLLSGWVCVVVPGYGCGWAPSTAIASQDLKSTKCVTMSSAMQSSSSTSWPQSGSNVKHLKRYDDVTPFKNLLQMMGHSLIGLDSSHYAIEDQDVSEILDACPNLTYLSLGGARLTNVSAIVDRYRSGQCKISSLDVRSDEPNNQIISQLAALLTEPFGKALLYLRAGGINDHPSINPEPFLALTSALQVNKTLRFLRLRCRGLDKSILKPMQDNMAAHESIHHVPNVAIAFLSVLAASPRLSTSLKTLDARMLSNVLDFAGIPVK